MKKLIFILSLLFSFTSQAQINYCDSMEINVTSGSQSQITMETNLTTIVPGIIDYYWETIDFWTGNIISIDYY